MVWSLLLVTPDASFRRAVERELAELASLTCVTTLGATRSALAGGAFDVVIADDLLPDGEGLDVVRHQLAADAPPVPVVVVGDDDHAEIGPRHIRAGAQDYLPKAAVTATAAAIGSQSALARAVRFAIERHRARAAAADRMEQLALVDPLTELLNRRGLERALRGELGRSRRTGLPLIAVLVDCDDFKAVNTRFGHAGGDAALRELAEALRRSLRREDAVGRIGGDEFLLLLPDTRVAEAVVVAERVRSAVAAAEAVLPEGVANISVSLGVAPVAEGTDSIADLLRATRAALEASKRCGKDRVSVAAGAGRVDASADPLAQLLEAGAIRASAEPIVELGSGQLAALELRPYHPAARLSGPDDFFRIALRSDALALVERRCLRACAERAATLPEGSHIQVHLFPATLRDMSASEVIAVIAPDGRLRHELVIAVSEAQIVGDPAYLIPHVEAFRAAGVKIALDDVGFGRSSLESLLVLQPDIIKADRRLTNGCSAAPERSVPLRRLLAIARAIDATLIAKGLEHRADVALARRIGVPLGQGPLWPA